MAGKIEPASARRVLDFDGVSRIEMVEMQRNTMSRRRRQLEESSDPIDGIAAERSLARNAGNDQLNNRMFFRLFQLGNELQRQAVQQLGITTVQWAVLGALSKESLRPGSRSVYSAIILSSPGRISTA